MDTINAIYGRNTLQFAPTEVTQVWKTESEQRSPQYTTCWRDLLEVSHETKKALQSKAFFVLSRALCAPY